VNDGEADHLRAVVSRSSSNFTRRIYFLPYYAYLFGKYAYYRLNGLP
jgi:hypothetical protein